MCGQLYFINIALFTLVDNGFMCRRVSDQSFV